MSTKNKIRKVAEQPKPVFDPNGSYIWEPSDEFVLNGQEFSLVYNVLHLLAASSEGVAPRVLVQAHNIVQEILKAGFEAGIVRKQDFPKQESDPVNS